MTRLSPKLVLVILSFILLKGSAIAQTCDSPQELCSTSGAETLNTDQGEAITVPAGFCFDNAENTVFYSFETLDLNQFPNLAYEDSTAFLSIASINCEPDTTTGTGVNFAVFTATDICDETTFSQPIICQEMTSAAQEIDLNELAPSTTYYIAVSGATGDAPADNPSFCDVAIGVSGPAVTYNLEAEWYPEPDPDRAQEILLEGETAVLEANENFPGLTWSGEALNSNSGSPVTANPEGVDENYVYTVETTINGCVYTDEVTVVILAAIVPDNAFTPNGDGFNDSWYIDRITEWPNAQIVVYSRWGQKVFEVTNYNNDWDGEGLPAATYYYVIELNPIDFNTNPYTGAVTIVR
ncbi:MAG: gliding motility-associated C-terminal domain-containing protein [Flavobacteriales bacterium]|nr:gliding motility-associated C-terminal domain-containing protein [Flavobacteriales bacterium]